MFKTRTPKTILLSLLAFAAGASAFFQLKRSANVKAKKRKHDLLVDEMSDQSFPASDAPAY